MGSQNWNRNKKNESNYTSNNITNLKGGMGEKKQPK